MWNDILTPDNTPLSRVTNGGSERLGAEKFAINCKLVSFAMPQVTDVSEQVADLLSHSLSVNTERAYRSDLSQFRDWGGSILATPAMICAYIAGHAGQLSVATIRRRIATVSKVHETLGVQNPCRNEIVRATLRGLRRKHGTAQKQAKPLLRDDLFLVSTAASTACSSWYRTSGRISTICLSPPGRRNI